MILFFVLDIQFSLVIDLVWLYVWLIFGSYVYSGYDLCSGCMQSIFWYCVVLVFIYVGEVVFGCFGSELWEV